MAAKKTKSENVKIRVEPFTKLTLERIAEEEGLQVADIARWAFDEFISRRQHEPQNLAA